MRPIVVFATAVLLVVGIVAVRWWIPAPTQAHVAPRPVESGADEPPRLAPLPPTVQVPSIAVGVATATDLAPVAVTMKRPTALPSPLPDYLVERFKVKDPERDPANLKSIVEYKLRLLDGLDRCLEGRVTAKGTIRVWADWDALPGTKILRGSKIERIESTFSADDDSIILDCLDRVHRGASREADVVAESSAGATPYRIRLPVDDDDVYELVRTGSWRW